MIKQWSCIFCDLHKLHSKKGITMAKQKKVKKQKNPYIEGIVRKHLGKDGKS